MAVVFISPKRRQRMFFMGITIMFLLFLATVYFGVFLSAPKTVTPTLTFNKPKVNVNMSIFDSDQFKNLQPFPSMDTQYSYIATSTGNKVVTGFIIATTVDDARSKLEKEGLDASVIKEVLPGRDNPFVPYSQSVTPPTTGAKTVKKK